MKLLFSLLILSLIAFSNDDLKEDLETLASPEYEGRVPGSEGIEKAAQFIKSKFEELDLEPVNGSYFSEFELEQGKKLTGENTVSFEVIIPKPGIPKDRLRPRTRSWEVGNQYLPMGFSANGSYSGEMVFVGYGISSKEHDYDDYEGIDVTDKAVIVIGGSPEAKSETDRFSRYSSLRYKVSNAKKKNAKAVIFVMMPGDSADVYTPLSDGSRFSGDATLPVIHATRDELSKLFPRDKQLSIVEQKINDELKPRSYVIPNTTINFTVNLEAIKISTKNVVGLLEGNGNSDKKLFIGAHYDHLGLTKGGSSRYRGEGKKIHLGADDNASGVAGIIDLARRLSERQLDHDVIFGAWTAEEMGLIGSKDFTTNNAELLSNVNAYFNFDMIGRLGENNIQVLGTGTSEELKKILDEVKTEKELELKEIASGKGPSDHTSFYTNDIAVLSFFSGIHADYHTPDDVPEKIDYEGMTKILDFAEEVIARSDKLDEIDVQEVAENPKASQIRRISSKVRMGVIPNYYDTDHGFVIEGVSVGGPAARAGLLAGDIILSVGDDEINDIYDFMYSYWDKEPNEVLDVKVLREGREKPFILKVKLEGKE